MDQNKAIEILKEHSKDDNIFNIILAHSQKVKEIAIKIAEDIDKDTNKLDIKFIRSACILHDIGRTSFSTKKEGALKHGIEGARLLREYGEKNDIDMEPFALVCERHLGAGIRKEDIEEQKLDLPKKDYLPISLEEKIITVADCLVETEDGIPIEVSIDDAVKRFSEEVNEKTGKRLRQLHDEVIGKTFKDKR